MTLLPVAYQPFLVLLIIILLFIALIKEWNNPPVNFLFAVVLLVVFGVLEPKEILSGLANESIASIVLLILITAGVRTHFNVEQFLDLIFKRAKTYKQFLALMMTNVAFLSSFVNNTPVVVLMTPYVFEWGKQNSISPSKLLIPLSYATIIGGMITVIGTSTTLVLNGFLDENNLVLIDHVQLFKIGFAVTTVGIVFLVLLGDKLLPSKEDLLERFELNKREYLIEKRLSKDSDLIGKKVKEGGLRDLKGVYLVEIVRDDKIISPVSPKEIILEDDVLIFAGNTDTVIDLSISKMGIALPESITPSGSDALKVVEAVISSNSSLIGRTIKSSNFRERYDAAVVAIHRNGEKLSGKIGRMTVKSGDVLLMYVGQSFSNKVDVFKDLYIISGEEREINYQKGDSKKIIGVALLAAALVIFRPFSLFFSLLIIAAVMFGFKLITLQNIKRDLDINMLAILVLSLALGQGMINSGAGTLVAHELVLVLKPFGIVPVLIGLMVITALLTAFITNVGAVSIAFPIAYGLSQDLGMDGAPLYLAVAFAASAAFISPVGYQTNLIVYGPGGYNFKDFIRIGVPMTIVYLIVVIVGLLLTFPALT